MKRSSIAKISCIISQIRYFSSGVSCKNEPTQRKYLGQFHQNGNADIWREYKCWEAYIYVCFQKFQFQNRQEVRACSFQFRRY